LRESLAVEESKMRRTSAARKYIDFGLADSTHFLRYAKIINTFAVRGLIDSLNPPFKTDLRFTY
ncbi:MAG: hypothetical protein ACI4JX_02355, partial [Oscillospiraceae bacterium]